jgi:serine/threonine-protein kinase
MEPRVAGSEVDPDVLDRYLTAIQAGDRVSETALLAATPGLAAWTDCLRDLDGLATTMDSIGGPDRAAAPTVVGRVFGAYRIVAELGRGGMGVVYRARHVELGREVALKLLAAGAYATDDHRRRFLSETRLAAGIRHPNVVAIHDAGDLDGQLWCAMDLVEGDDLAALLTTRRLPPRESVRLMAEVARAVAHLHASGIHHRDLKPSNILIDASGNPHLVDFGLACGADSDRNATATGTILGTPGYMAPEQAAGRNREVDERSDIYALGAILYELLAGRPPFLADTPVLTLLQVIERDALPTRRFNAGVPRDLDALVLACLEKAPARRPATAAGLADELEAWLGGAPIGRGGVDPFHRLRRLVRRYPAAGFRLVGIAGTMAVVIAKCVVDPGTTPFYIPMIAGLVVWGGLAVVCERLGITSPRTGRSAYAFTLTDAALVTYLLWRAGGVATPLVAVYPLLVCVAGLWLEPRLVRVAATASLAGYTLLVVMATQRPYWHVTLLVALFTLCAAAITEFQIGRVRIPRA